MPKEAVILLAEDHDDDIVLIGRALARARIINPLQVVRDGAEAISYFKGAGKYSDRVEHPLPDLLLLDLQMPVKDGFEVLKWVRRQPSLDALRILVLTSSDSLRDVNLAYQLGADSFLVKPIEFEDSSQLGALIRDHWLNTSKTADFFREAPRRSANFCKTATSQAYPPRCNE